MDGTEEMPNLENVCRLCLAEEDATTQIISTESLAEKIQAYLAIQVTADDRISTLICSNCIVKVNKWHSYKESCQRSQEKLQHWLTKQTTEPHSIQIKEEPVEMVYMDNGEILNETDEQNLVEAHTVTIEVNGEITPEENAISEKDSEEDPLHSRISRSGEAAHPRENNRIDDIKLELLSEEEMIDNDYVCDSEVALVLNPMAKAKQSGSFAEPDSTQNVYPVSTRSKRKMRRIKTHFQNKKSFKRKCNHCRIYLHSKWSFNQHMERFHNIYSSSPLPETKPKLVPKASPVVKKTSNKPIMPIRMSARIAEAASLQQQELENSQNELSDELNKDINLTPMQLELIGQLKTFSCYTCKQNFADRRQTFSHLRSHVPELKIYTCIACLTAFQDRTIYKNHCIESYDCAMKIAYVVPKFGTEKYFTCNMCWLPLSSRQELLDHLANHAPQSPVDTESIDDLLPVKRQVFTPTNVPRPYMNGDPAHNHECDLCGMIYKHKVNMEKHRVQCFNLSPHSRISYRCIYCGFTFLIYKKFYTHVHSDHKRKDLVCYLCGYLSYSPEEFSTHYDTHREIDDTEPPPILNENESSEYNCTLCGEKFTDLAEYTEHRNLHLKVKIYSCVICRSMFSSAATLEEHMQEHGVVDEQSLNERSMDDEMMGSEEDSNGMDVASVSDTGGRLPRCPECSSTFANGNNVTRHMKNVHRIDRSICNHCYEVFVTKEELGEHIRVSHPAGKISNRYVGPRINSQRRVMKCPSCKKVYMYESALHHHCQKVHGYNYKTRTPYQKPSCYKCELCSKTFKEEFSMRIHKTWHYRSDSRLAKGIPNSKLSPIKEPPVALNNTIPAVTAPKPAKARKSFPNNPPSFPQVRHQSIQCQVCNESYPDVHELRKHLWEQHCSKSKQEKPFIINELQCELCTNIFQDRQSLDDHMTWHRANPILSNNSAPVREVAPQQHSTSVTCSICGKVCANKKILYKHRKIHKMPIVTKIPGSQLKKAVSCGTCAKIFSTTGNLAKHRAMTGCGMMGNRQIKKDIHSPNAVLPHKKPVNCLTCKISFPNMQVLYQHRQIMHNKNKVQATTSNLVVLSDNQGGVICNLCGKRFNSVPALKQHYTLKHKGVTKPAVVKTPKGTKVNAMMCRMKNCRQMFSDPHSLKIHEVENHSNILYNCQMCERHFFNKSIIVKHVQNTHKAAYSVGDTNTNEYFEEIDLNAYEIPNLSNPRECPLCMVRYPNTKALKIHYYKIHDRNY